MRRIIRLIGAGALALFANACAGAYVAGDVGAHRDSDKISRLDRPAAASLFALSPISIDRHIPEKPTRA